MTTPDIFTNVHKGIRKTLFDACVALGRAGDDPDEGAAARALLRDALRFVAHHGENEDALLLPLLRERAAAVFSRIHEAHGHVNAALEALMRQVDSAPTPELYAKAATFTALYLEHMHEEEHILEPEIRRALSTEELANFGQQAVARTPPAERPKLLACMLPAMTRADATALLSRLPPELSDALRPLAQSG